MKDINICMTFDDNYSMLACVSIISIFKNNKEAPNITIYIFENEVSIENKNKILDVAKKYRRNIKFINSNECLKKILSLGYSEWGSKNSYVTFVRLFIANYIEDNIDKLLYIDCDTCINSSLQSLFNIEMGNYPLAAVQDVLPSFYKESLGFEKSEPYFNAGVLMINIKMWKKYNYLKKCLELLEKRMDYPYADQDVINLVFKNNIKSLEPKYCGFYPEYMWKTKLQYKYVRLSESEYYTKEELKEAKNRPVIIHFVDCIFGRPWFNNNFHPYSRKWKEYFNDSPYANQYILQHKEISLLHKFLRKLYIILPQNIFCKIYYYKRDKLLLIRSNLNKKFKLLES